MLHAVMDFFESKRFGALFTGAVALATFAQMGMDRWRALALALLCMGAYWLLFRGPR